MRILDLMGRSHPELTKMKTALSFLRAIEREEEARIMMHLQVGYQKLSSLV
jgi:hypothetical protein